MFVFRVRPREMETLGVKSRRVERFPPASGEAASRRVNAEWWTAHRPCFSDVKWWGGGEKLTWKFRFLMPGWFFFFWRHQPVGFTRHVKQCCPLTNGLLALRGNFSKIKKKLRSVALGRGCLICGSNRVYSTQGLIQSWLILPLATVEGLAGVASPTIKHPTPPPTDYD